MKTENSYQRREKKSLIKLSAVSAKFWKLLKCLSKILFNMSIMGLYLRLLPCFCIIFKGRLKSGINVFQPAFTCSKLTIETLEQGV